MSTERAGNLAFEAVPRNRDIDFLAGGGEMGARMRSFDWSSSPVGPPECWPQSLRATVSLMINSKYPMFLAWGPELAFLYNDGYAPIFGEKHPHALGRPFAEIWREIWEDIRPLVERALAGEATWSEDLQLFMHRRGYPEEVYFTFSYSPVHDETGGVAGMFCACTETTERVLGERRMKLLRDLAAQSTGTETVAEVLAGSREVLGRSTLDLPFALFYSLADEDRARLEFHSGECAPGAMPETLLVHDEQACWPLRAPLREGRAELVEDVPATVGPFACQPWPEPLRRACVLPVKTSGHEQPAGCLVVGLSTRREYDQPYRDFLGLVAGQLAASIDKARSFESERRRAEALAEIDRAKTVFFSNVSHEFRTPLTLMLGPLEETLARGGLTAQHRERLELAHRNALRLLRLVNSLLEFSRIEAGRVQASYRPTDIAAVTRDLASNFRSAIELAGLTYEVDCEAIDEPVHLDRDMWEKIVLNLLSNAFKFTLEGAIAVRLRRQGQAIELEVADTGVGVPAEALPRLFDRFYRIEGTRGRTQEGSGIGLALVQELVHLHGGSIAVESEPGRGTSFRVRLPLGTAHLPAERVASGDARPSTAVAARAFVQEALRWLPDDRAPSALHLGSAEPAVEDADRRFAATFGSRIVLADDNADMRSYVRNLLGPHYAVECCATGAQALAAARREAPDLILSDVMMPELDGFGVLAALHDDPALRETPVLLLSARAGEEARIEGLDAGAADYVVKPFSARELLARVGALLERRRLHREALRTEQALAEAFRLRTEQFETLFDIAPVGIYLVDSGFRLRAVNPTARPAFGDLPGLIGRDFAEVLQIIWGQDAKRLTALFRRTLETGEPFAVPEYAQQREDRGVTEYYEWRIERIPLPEGGHGVVCCFRDITLTVAAREALVQQQRQLQVADRQKDDFLAMLAHELRNPLAPIRNASEVLARLGGTEPRARAATEMIRRQVLQLTRLVDDLLDISRITRGRIELEDRPVEIADVVAQALETVEPLVRERRHRVSLNSQFGRLSVRGDAVRLVQCVVNLLTNAVKYTDPGGEITVRTREEEDRVVVEVTDTGAGIPPELLPKVFDLFVQADRTLDRAQGGLGIGLSVVKRLVEMHGGSVSAHSDGIGRGSTFRIELPRSEAAQPAGTAPARGAAPARRVLVVDDNRDAAVSLAVLLELEGHEVRTASEGEEALALLDTWQPDIALLDIGLPQMDGYQLAARLRQRPGGEEITLIALTGYGQSQDRERALAAGFHHHVVKPMDLAALQPLIEHASRPAGSRLRRLTSL